MVSIRCSGLSGATRYSLTPAAHQFAIELHVVDAADDDDLGGLVADLGQLVEFGEHRRALVARFHDQEIRRRVVAEIGSPPAATPPSCTVTCALASRRSATAR